MQAVVWEAVDRVAVREVAPPEPRDGYVVVETAWCGICGSDLHIVAGEHPRAEPGIVLGHEVVGLVANPASGFEVGQRVVVNPMLACGDCDACRRGYKHACPHMVAVGVDVPGGLAERLAVPATALRRLPEALDLRRAALIEPLAVAVRAVRLGQVSLGDRVHVLGAGPIGRLVAICAAAAGAGRLTISETAQGRRASAAAAGLEVLDEPDDHGAAAVVFDTAGHPSVSPTITRWARVGARIIVVAAYPPQPVAVNLLEVMLKELTVTGSRVYTWPDLDAAIELLVQEQIDVDGLVSRVVGLGEVGEALAHLQAGTEVKVLVDLHRS
jgi:(R,R)-butanediol dehydrogenase / meso-butanediol dehydrogenase / diacetyl reductase